CTEEERSMRRVFADTSYWIAMLNPKDTLHAKALEVSKSLGQHRIVTSEMVLVELMNGLSGAGDVMRRAVVETIRSLDRNPNVDLIPQTSLLFQAAVERYSSRLDKEWGATDCASFILME